MRLHLIRHGQTDWNATRRIQGQTDSSLNQTGYEQARQLMTVMNDQQFEHIYCSSSLRTRQTAASVFGHREIPCTFLDSLREINLGPWEGRFYSEIELSEPEQFHNFFHAPHLFSIDGAETYADLQQRAMTAVQQIRNAGHGGEVAVVSHGALIKSVLNHIEQKPLSRLWEPPLMPNCSHTILEFQGDRGMIVKYL